MRRWTKTILGVLILAAIFVWFEIAKSPSADVVDNSVHIFFLNVGQGDAELIQEGNYQILIDGGPDDSVLAQIGEVMPVTDRKIETVILSHPHADHITGLNSILDRYEVGQIYYSGVFYDSNVYKEFLDKARAKNIPLKIPEVLQKENPFANSELTFLWPGQRYKDRSIDNLNNSSEVVSFCYFAHCALFTGDIETDEQATMIANYSSNEVRSSQPAVSNNSAFQSDILKLPHHGSTNGTNQVLLDLSKPKYAVIEVGANNQYGHPHAATLDLLDKNKILYFRTDRDGMIDFLINETGIIKK